MKISLTSIGFPVFDLTLMNIHYQTNWWKLFHLYVKSSNVKYVPGLQLAASWSQMWFGSTMTEKFCHLPSTILRDAKGESSNWRCSQWKRVTRGNGSALQLMLMARLCPAAISPCLVSRIWSSSVHSVSTVNCLTFFQFTVLQLSNIGLEDIHSLWNHPERTVAYGLWALQIAHVGNTQSLVHWQGGDRVTSEVERESQMNLNKMEYTV